MDHSPVGRAALRKATLRLIPFMFVLYVAAYLDRVNVGFAQLQMKQDLRFSDAVYGLGAGLFFLGYFVFEVPSNLLLQRVGPRRWIARIMITWGLLSAATMFVRSPGAFYAVRVLLGLAEAGFFPGMILYLTYWFPARERARAVARFMTAIAVASLVGSPVSGLIMERMRGVAGWSGWQWLFLLEGLPSVALGVAVLFLLPDGPAEVRWLSADEKAWLAETLQREAQAIGPRGAHRLRDAFANGRVWVLALVYFCFATGLYGFGFWLPQLVKQLFGFGPFGIGLVTALPYLLAVAAMVLWAGHSDRTGERRWHLVVSTGGCGVATFAAALKLGAPVAAVALLSVAIAAIFASFGPFWALPTAFLRGTAAAAGIAVINSFGNLGGFASPVIIGVVKKQTGGFAGGLLFVAGVALAASALLALFGRERR